MSFVAQQQQQRPDEVVMLTLVPRAKKTVTWAEEVVENESCKHCKKLAKYQKKTEGKLLRKVSPTRKYLTSLVVHLLT